MPAPLTFNTPGRWGVNEQEKNQLLNPNWATVADGLVINDAGQLQCRGALNLISTDGAPTEILRSFVYVGSDGTERVIHTTATRIISGIADLDDAGVFITSPTTPTNGFWQFQNFNGKVVGWQAGHAPIVKTGAGNFADIVAASGTLPDGDCVCAAFGRLWAVDDDGQTVRYCALLDETRWATADGGGSIDMRNVWPAGMDRVTAIKAFGGNLVVFGRRSIVIYTDGSGSTTGVDPDQMYVVDQIAGTGCVSRDTVCEIGEGDLVFLSEIGLQTLGRVIASKDNPLESISWQIGDRLADAIAAEVVSATDLRTWTGHYIPQTGQYMLTHTTNEDVFVFHTGGKTQDEKGRFVVPITIFDTSILVNIRGFITTRSGITYTTGSATHELYQYDTSLSLDEGDVAIAVRFEGGWLDNEQQVLLLLKLVQITALNPATISSKITLRYASDYSTTIATEAPVAAKATDRVIFLYDPSGDQTEGQYFKFGFSDTSFGRKVLTQIHAQFKTARTAFIHKNFSDANPSEAYVSGSVVLAASRALTAAASGATLPEFKFDSDGTFVLTNPNSITFELDSVTIASPHTITGEWWSGSGLIGANYEVRLTITSGASAHGSGAAAATWLGLGSDRTFVLNHGTDPPQVSVWLFEIRDAASQLVLDSVTFTVSTS
jgi:hypothetical protein